MDPPYLTRRSALKTAGGIGLAGAIGAASLSAPAEATMITEFEAGDVTVSSDDGDVTEVHLNPHGTVAWEGFDVPVVMVMQTIQAHVFYRGGDGPLATAQLSDNSGGTRATNSGVWPIWRETTQLFSTDGSAYDRDPDFQYTTDDGDQPAWLLESGDEAPDHVEDASAGTSGFLEQDMVPSSTDPDREVPPAIYLVHEDYPMPDYLADHDTEYIDGLGLDGGGNYVNGAYGTVSDGIGFEGTSLFDNETDDSERVGQVTLSLTTALHTAWDFAENNPKDIEDDDTPPVAMARSDEVEWDVRFLNPERTSYSNLGEKWTHPAIDKQKARFEVTAVNEPPTVTSSAAADTGGT